MPVLREITLKPGDDMSGLKYRPEYDQAKWIQAVGVEQNVPCERCARGRGHFVDALQFRVRANLRRLRKLHFPGPDFEVLFR
jgi:hypothetical protein